jgi:hypothetical protein
MAGFSAAAQVSNPTRTITMIIPTTTSARASSLPDLSMFAETGLASFDVNG